MKNYSIGEIAQKYQLSVATLRYYDEKGLLPFVKRNEYGQRIFTADDLGYLEVIACLKKSAIPLKDIKVFMQWCIQGDSTLPKRYEFMVSQEEILEQKINVLQANLEFLRWKKWYYAQAKTAGSEKMFFKTGTTQVDSKWRQKYLLEASENSSK
ncbi:transcriptional regulator [Enterococcus saigonensis]|uniref:Transcriptional regulator n=1 Tax=Enterococcus saigonensis TaxID=1805431 RepID=A0A679ICK3_9ENTE|nr:MerR family transcriptional regulator [Enterococcus saigonensis]BCA86020.1 transcriptional regulator [Enterococcus saigonensis]